MRWHVRAAHLQFLQALESDLADDDDNDRLSMSAELESAKNDGISCELGIRYPTLQSIMSGNKNILSIKVIICYI
jgi:hypothetical protein